MEIQADLVKDLHISVKAGTLPETIKSFLEENDAETLSAGLNWILEHHTECQIDDKDERAIRGQLDLLAGWGKRPEQPVKNVDVKPGIYQHYKGKFYNLLMIGRHTETGEDVAIYTPLYCHHEGGRVVQVRPLKMFTEEVVFTDPVEIKMYGAERMPRFAYIGEQLPAAPVEI